MNKEEAKEALMLYRPGMSAAQEPEFAAALEVVRQDPELQKWFESHCAVQTALCDRFARIPVPEGLKEQILSERPAERAPVADTRAARYGLMLAALVLTLGLASLFLPRENHEFAAFRHRMAGMVLRAYPTMDLETSDVDQIRKFLAQHHGHGNYTLPPGLQQVASTGCKMLTWHGRSVSMVCFNSGTNGRPADPDLFLFVIDRHQVSAAPASKAPIFSKVSSMTTASWSDGERVYVLGTVGDEPALRRYF